MGFEVEQWREIAEVFGGSLDFVLTNVKRSYSPEGQERINKFVYDFVITQKPYMLMTQLGEQGAVETVFSDELIRDFILTVGFQFFTRWGGSAERLNTLVESLAFAVSATDSLAGDRRQNLIPGPILEDLPQESRALSVLRENKWLVVLLLMLLTVEIPLPPEAKKQKNRPE
jgi:hypothetical protein